MAKADMTNGPGNERGRDESVTKRDEYRAPKLTVVGTVHDLTLGTGNAGGLDGIYRTQQGG